MAALLSVAMVACGDDSSGGAGGSGDKPGPGADGSVNDNNGPGKGPSGTSASLRRVGSCDEVAAVLGDYIAGFGEGTLGFNVEEERFDCPWTREPDPEGERIYSVAVSGIYTNTPELTTRPFKALAAAARRARRPGRGAAQACHPPG